MSLAFLAKKSWHTATLKNSERVWIAEKKKSDEEKKLKELRRQLEEEREVEEMQRLGGGEAAPSKLNWMYEGPQAMGPSTEDYLTGATFKPEEEVGEVAQLEQAPGSLWLQKATSSKNETFLRLHGDPLLQIKQQQQAARKAVLSNPVRMQQIRQEVLKKVKKEKKEKKEKKKKKHKHKHKHHKHDRQERRDNEGDRWQGRSDGDVGRGRRSENGRRGEDSDRRRGYGDYERRREGGTSDRPSSLVAVKTEDSGGSSSRHRKKPGYGLRMADGTLSEPVAVSGQLGPSSAVRDSRSGFVEAQRAKRPAVQHRAAGLSQDAKRQKLESMVSAAKQNEKDREVRHAKKADEEAEEERRGRTAKTGPLFLASMRNEAGESSIEEAIRSKKHGSQRSAGNQGGFLQR